jgi:hypothetical protein
LELTVNGKKEFCDEKVIQGDVVSKSFLVVSNNDKELPETGCTNASFAEKDLAGGGKDLELSSHAVEVTWYVNCLL